MVRLRITNHELMAAARHIGVEIPEPIQENGGNDSEAFLVMGYQSLFARGLLTKQGELAAAVTQCVSGVTGANARIEVVGVRGGETFRGRVLISGETSLLQTQPLVGVYEFSTAESPVTDLIIAAVDLPSVSHGSDEPMVATSQTMADLGTTHDFGSVVARTSPDTPGTPVSWFSSSVELWLLDESDGDPILRQVGAGDIEHAIRSLVESVLTHAGPHS